MTSNPFAELSAQIENLTAMVARMTEDLNQRIAQREENNNDSERLYTEPEAAEFLRLSRTSVRNLRFNKHLPCIKFGSSVRYRESDLQRLVDEGEKDLLSTSYNPKHK